MVSLNFEIIRNDKSQNLDPIIGVFKTVKRTFGTPITEADAERLNKIRIRNLQSKYLKMWREAVAIKKARKEERKFKISPNTYQLPNLFLLRQEQKRRLYESNMFPNRKRKSDVGLLSQLAEKRFFTSTPYRGAYQENFLSSTISPVLYVDSPPSSDTDNNLTL